MRRRTGWFLYMTSIPLTLFRPLLGIGPSGLFRGVVVEISLGSWTTYHAKAQAASKGVGQRLRYMGTRLRTFNTRTGRLHGAGVMFMISEILSAQPPCFRVPRAQHVAEYRR